MLNDWMDVRSYTLKHYLIIGGVLLFLAIATYLYTSTKKEEAEQQRAAKDSFVLMYGYEEDLMRPVLEEELTLDELVEVIVSEQLGAGAKPTTLSKGTIRKDLGLFVESGIIEGGIVPQISALSKDVKESMNREQSSEYMERLFAEISKNKREAIANYRDTSVDDTTLLLQELKSRMGQP